MLVAAGAAKYEDVHISGTRGSGLLSRPLSDSDGHDGSRALRVGNSGGNAPLGLNFLCHRANNGPGLGDHTLDDLACCRYVVYPSRDLTARHSPEIHVAFQERPIDPNSACRQITQLGERASIGLSHSQTAGKETPP